MAKSVRLDVNSARAWVHAHYLLVNDQGDVVRPAKAAEVAQLGVAQARKRDLRIMVGEQRCRFISSREIMKRNLFAQHGDCILKWPNGKFIATVRDPKLDRPKFQTSVERSAPNPTECECKTWGEPHPGRHHVACQWNRYAPKLEKADPKTRLTEEPIVLSEKDIPEEPAAKTTAVPTRAFLDSHTVRAPAPEDCVCREWQWPDGLAHAGHHPICQFFEDTGANTGASPLTPEQQEPVLSPEECICKDWQRDDPGEAGHHPICQYHDAWLFQQSDLEVHYLYDVSTHPPRRLRRATYEELMAAQRVEAETGTGLIEIEQQNFLVAPGRLDEPAAEDLAVASLPEGLAKDAEAGFEDVEAPDVQVSP